MKSLNKRLKSFDQTMVLFPTQCREAASKGFYSSYEGLTRYRCEETLPNGFNQKLVSTHSCGGVCPADEKGLITIPILVSSRRNNITVQDVAELKDLNDFMNSIPKPPVSDKRNMTDLGKFKYHTCHSRKHCQIKQFIWEHYQ